MKIFSLEGVRGGGDPLKSAKTQNCSCLKEPQGQKWSRDCRKGCPVTRTTGINLMEGGGGGAHQCLTLLMLWSAYRQEAGMAVL